MYLYRSTRLHCADESGAPQLGPCAARTRTCIDTCSHREVVGVLQYRAGESDRSFLNLHHCGMEHWRSTVIRCAAVGGHVRTVEELLDAGFNTGHQDGGDNTPAEISASQSRSTSATITRPFPPTSDRGECKLYDLRHIEHVAVRPWAAHSLAFGEVGLEKGRCTAL